nr:gamma-soluble NSF attachment protein isoform X3 [Ovis aries]
MAAQKINEGLEHLAKAEKYLKTGFLKWKPDYDSAASEYGKAAVAFKNAKQFEQAKDACLKEAVAHENNRAYLFNLWKCLFHAAKAYEQAGMMLKEMQKLPEAVHLIEKASMMYLENGTPDTAAMALERAGKMKSACGRLSNSWGKPPGCWCAGAGLMRRHSLFRKRKTFIRKLRIIQLVIRKQSPRSWCTCTETTTWRLSAVSARATASPASMAARTALPWSSSWRAMTSKTRTRWPRCATRRCSSTWTMIMQSWA